MIGVRLVVDVQAPLRVKDLYAFFERRTRGLTEENQGNEAEHWICLAPDRLGWYD